MANKQPTVQPTQQAQAVGLAGKLAIAACCPGCTQPVMAVRLPAAGPAYHAYADAMQQHRLGRILLQHLGPAPR